MTPASPITSAPAEEPSAVIPEFGWETDEGEVTAAYLPQTIERLLPDIGPGTRVLDIGSGNGYFAGRCFLSRGCTVVGVDPSEQGVLRARERYPDGRFEQIAVREDLLEQLGEQPFDVVVSLEVVEHVYLPDLWARSCYNALKPGGVLLSSTPYHGYLKNLAIAIAGKFDGHWQPLRNGGHIKFFSRATLSQLLEEAGFVDLHFAGSGRLPLLWKSMVMRCRRPQ